MVLKYDTNLLNIPNRQNIFVIFLRVCIKIIYTLQFG
jgi:hypothetical protein